MRTVSPSVRITSPAVLENSAGSAAKWLYTRSAHAAYNPGVVRFQRSRLVARLRFRADCAILPERRGWANERCPFASKSAAPAANSRRFCRSRAHAAFLARCVCLVRAARAARPISLSRSAVRLAARAYPPRARFGTLRPRVGLTVPLAGPGLLLRFGRVGFMHVRYPGSRPVSSVFFAPLIWLANTRRKEFPTPAELERGASSGRIGNSVPHVSGTFRRAHPY